MPKTTFIALILTALLSTGAGQQATPGDDPGFRHPVARNAHQTYQQRLARAYAAMRDEVAAAQADYRNELDRAAELCRRGGYTDELARISQAKESLAPIDITELQKQLAQAQQAIEQLSSRLQSMHTSAAADIETHRRMTGSDITLQADLAQIQGAELLLDGYVVDVSVVDGNYRAIIAAGIDTPRGEPVMIRSSGGREYQVQVHVTGEQAATLRAGDARRRVRGIIQSAKVERGEMYARTGLSHLPQTTRGMIIVLEMDRPTIY